MNAEDIKILPDDPSPCPHCHRLRATSSTPIDATDVCWRKPSMQESNVCVIDCKEYAQKPMKWRCRWFGHKPETRLYDPFVYALQLAHAVAKGEPYPPQGKIACRRCGVTLGWIPAESVEQLAERLSKR